MTPLALTDQTDALPMPHESTTDSGAPQHEYRVPVLTKIIATLGPATDDTSAVRQLIECGVSVFRLNFSHGTADEHEARLNTVRRAAAELGRPTAVLGDLPGPKIRISRAAGAGAEVSAGERVLLQRDEPNGVGGGDGPWRFACTYPELIDDVQVGHRVLIADGAVRLLTIDRDDDWIECRVTQGGTISAGKGVNLPDTELTLPSLTERDHEYVRWAVGHEIDFLALSFVRTADDVHALRELVQQRVGQRADGALRMPIVAKVELPMALRHIDGIVEEADGLMVARGDLGVEMDLARVPVIQKQLIAKARENAKPCIVATQMLESMVDAQTPTRAEASDVAGAIFDGADAVMLSGETAIGKYPQLAVEHMHRIAWTTERYIAEQPSVLSAPSKPMETRYRTAIVAHGAWVMARDLGAKYIVVWSQQGGGARYLSQFDVQIPVIAISSDDRALRQMQFLRGVTPVRMNVPEDLTHFTQMVDIYLQETRWGRSGDPCILMAGEPLGESGVTNQLAVHHIGDPKTGFQSMPLQ